MITTESELLESFLDFNWNFGQLFLVTNEPGIEDETVEEYKNKDRSSYQYFIWSDPDYNGDNSFKEVTYNEWQEIWGQVCRAKGRHIVMDYCGPNIKITFLPR